MTGAEQALFWCWMLGVATTMIVSEELGRAWRRRTRQLRAMSAVVTAATDLVDYWPYHGVELADLERELIDTVARYWADIDNEDD